MWRPDIDYQKGVQEIGVFTSYPEIACSYARFSNAEVYVSDEMAQYGLTPEKLLSLAWEESARIIENPFAVTNLDFEETGSHAKMARTVHKIHPYIQAQYPFPIAVKGPGYQKGAEGYRYVSHQDKGGELVEDLVAQYTSMREKAIAFSQTFSQEQREALDILPVYGAVRFTHEGKHYDFLFMHAVEEGVSLSQDQEPIYSSVGGRYEIIGTGFPRERLPQVLEAFPQIAAIPGEVISWGDMRRVIERSLPRGITFGIGNFNGRSLLQDRQTQKCYIIDLRDR